jgi:hypothetical protein
LASSAAAVEIVAAPNAKAAAVAIATPDKVFDIDIA